MKKALVAYFSITGVTEHAANKLARAIEADLYEVKPLQPISRDTLLHEDGHPAQDPIQFEHKNIDAYDIIFVGLPIWWYAAPTVIHNFLSDYDLTGKTVVPFVTSGAGGLDKVKPRLQKSCPGADLRDASLLEENMSFQQLMNWAEKNGY